MHKILSKLNEFFFRILGLRVTKSLPFAEEIYRTDPIAYRIMQNARERSMTSENSLYNLIEATRYIVINGIAGDFVECGVWRGGSMIAVAETLMSLNVHDRKLFLLDTFQGMTPPQAMDIDFQGQSAENLMTDSPEVSNKSYLPGVIAFATLDDVREGMVQTGYPIDRTFMVPGDVMVTLPKLRTRSIAILRLDTDWYESTTSELEELWERIVPGGVLFIDDYDYWSGARQATDEFFRKLGINPFMMKLASGGRVILKL
jgi:hypothetical protein